MKREWGVKLPPFKIHFDELKAASQSFAGNRSVWRKKRRRRGRSGGRGCPSRVQRVSLSVMRARTKQSPLYTTECSVYYTNGQWLTPPPIETNTWDVVCMCMCVCVCLCLCVCRGVGLYSTYKGSLRFFVFVSLEKG